MCGIRPPGYRDLFLTQHPARAVRCRLYAANGADRSKLELAARDDPLHRHRHASRARCRNGFLSIFAIRPANWPFARICNSTRGKTTVAELLKDASPYADACRQGRTEPVKLPPLGNAVAEFAALEDARRRCGYARQGERNYRCGSLRCRVNFTSRSLHVDKGAAGRRQGSAGLDRRRHRCAAAIGLAVL